MLICHVHTLSNHLLTLQTNTKMSNTKVDALLQTENSRYIYKFDVLVFSCHTQAVAHVAQSEGCGLLVDDEYSGYSGYSFSLLWTV